MGTLKIKSVQITTIPKNLFDPLPKVLATFEDNTVQELFSYYPDEISFSEEEFIGLTEMEARGLKGKKDRAYLKEKS